jgi:hypothetical protein
VNDIEGARKCSEVDENNLHDLFTGYTVEAHRDLGLEDINRKIKQFAQREQPMRPRSDAVVVRRDL